MEQMKRESRIVVAGQTGLVGSVVVRALQRDDFSSVLTAARDQAAVNYWFKANRPELVKAVIHPGAVLRFDTSRPGGMPQKLLDVSRLHDRGWRHTIELEAGIKTTYEWYLTHGLG